MRKTPCLRLRTPAIILAVLLAPWQLTGTLADPYDPPPPYYDTATGTGATLQGQLHDIIDSHTVFSYGDARSIFQDTDVDPNDSDNIILVYDRVSLDISGLISGVGLGSRVGIAVPPGIGNTRGHVVGASMIPGLTILICTASGRPRPASMGPAAT